MIKFFRILNPVNLLWLILILIVLRFGFFIQLPETLPFNFLELFSRMLVPIPTNHLLTPSTNVFIAAVLVYIQALLINRLVNQYNLLAKPSTLPALTYITLCSLFIPFMVLSPPLICNFFIIWLFSKLLKFYKGEAVQATAFDSGMIVAAGTIIYFPFIFVFLIIWISLMVFRSFNWREWVAALMGFITVFFFLAVFYYWNDHISLFYKIWLPLGTHFPKRIKIDYYNYLVLIPAIAIMVLAIIKLQGNFLKSYVQTRKAFQLLFFMFVVTALSFYVNTSFRLYHFILCLVPAGIIMSYYFLYATRRWFYESLYILLLLSIIFFQFNTF